MTHQPRTDIFASLPHLIALANLKDLLENQQIDEQAVRLQAEAVQLAKLQYLQYFLQSAASISTTPYGQNGITEMDALNLLNSTPSSIKENPVLNSSQTENPDLFSQLGIESSQPLHYPGLLSHFPDPQVPISFQTPLNSEMGQCSNNFTMVSQGANQPDSSWILPSPPAVHPSVTDTTSVSNPGDASSTSSYGGGTSSYWPELFLEDPIMQEIS